MKRLSLKLSPPWAPNLIALSVLLAVAIAPEGEAQMLTFNRQVRTKMFIANIPLNMCDPVGVLGPPTGPGWLARSAAFIAFCKATSLGENPPNGEIYSPLDARNLAIVSFRWQCQVGSSIPVNLGQVTPVGAFPGMEGPFTGVANPIATANQILADGSWRFVASGHPSPFVEPAFQAQRIRFRTDIWHRASGSMSCGVDGRGNPTSTMNFMLSTTHFPSHRSYLYDSNVNPAAFQRIVHNKAQGLFSNLWYLPPVGAP
jgi:hypothetical protein